MALDVRLTRDTNERWGFEVFGGTDEELPLTIEKLQPLSPASRAGLQNGDMVLSINGEDAMDFTHEEACRRIAECEDTLLVGVERGLYDPVLDDHEPTYYEPGDLDPLSQPTEVPFKIQKFVEPEDLGSSLIDDGSTIDPLGTPFDPSVILTEARSLTASPFVTPTKPYRPFSTEPIAEVPPLEEPIILNPDYKDEFGESLLDINPDYILNAHGNNDCQKKFKLPISAQYDPDGTRLVKNAEVDSMLSKYANMEALSKKSMATDTKMSSTVVNDIKVTEKCSTNHMSNVSLTKQDLVKEIQLTDVDISKESLKITTEDVIVKEETHKQEELMKDVKITEKYETVNKNVQELKYMEKMKQEIDIAQIEETALSVVDNSIERAVSVAEEIKKEIEVELTSEAEKIIETSVTEHENIAVKESTAVIEKSSTVKESTEVNKVASETVTKRVVEDVSSESKDIKITKEKTISKTENEISENIATNKSKESSESKSIVSEQFEERNIQDSVIRKESITQDTSRSETKGEYKKVSTTVTTDTKSDRNAQQRTHAIGLQTIPNIRGTAHSSYHYDLLLRTFFLHLTDVMVALSRFILTQPIFNVESLEKREVVSETQTTGVKEIRKSQQEQSAKRVEKQQDLKQEKIEQIKEVVKPVVVQEKKHEIKLVAEKANVVLEKKIDRRQLVTPVSFIEEKKEKAVDKSEIKQIMHFNDSKKIEEEQPMIEEKKVVSGSEMAQRSEKKISKEISTKMDAVISEFQTIAVEENKTEMLQRNRRSRSRSQIEEEVAKESDPLEWLSKVDSSRASQEISEERLSQKDYVSTETTETKHIEKHETKHKKSKTPKQMYLAVVESHVYTNNDVIFEDASEFSETSSVKSAEESNTAYEAIEVISSENVALERAVQQIEQAEIKIEDPKDLVKVSAESTVTAQKLEEVVQKSIDKKQEICKQETVLQLTDAQQVIMQESREIIEPVIEIKETLGKEKLAINMNQSMSVAESSEINICESESEFTRTTVAESAAVVKEEQKENIESQKEVLSESCKINISEFKSEYANLASTESVTLIKEENKQSSVVESKKEILAESVSENDRKSQTEDVSTAVFIKSEKAEVKKEEECAALKIVKEVATAIESKNEILDIEEIIDVSENIEQDTTVTKIDMNKSLELNESHIITEKSSITTEYGLAQSEMTEEVDSTSTFNHIELKNTSENYISGSTIQESSFTARSVDKKLTLQTDLIRQQSETDLINTPTPSTVPPTPLTDEYVFKLTIPLPKSRDSTPIPRDCTPEDEDPHIVKKKLIPHIETTIEKVIYDPPLPTPPCDKIQSPIFKTPGLFGGSPKPIYKIKFPVRYRKPGLLGGADEPEYSREEIREIERKSSLLASAIDETIKSIEEYKEEVGMEKKKEVKFAEFNEEIVINNHQESYLEKTVIETQLNGYGETNSIEIKEIIPNGQSEEVLPVKASETVKEEVFETKLQNGSFETEINASIEDQSNNQDRSEAISVNNNKISQVPVSIEAKLIENAEMNTEIQTEANETCKIAAEVVKNYEQNEKEDPMLRVRPVVFDPEGGQKRSNQNVLIHEPSAQELRQSPYMTDSGEIMGTIQGIVDGLDKPVMDSELAKELGKPGISEEKIAELISGEAEMLREAHVMGLTRVLKSHMHRPDDSSVDFQKIKPMLGSLKDSEVLKALNEELERQREEERKKEEKKWTTFLQKPKRAVPKAKFGYHGWTEAEQALVAEPYKVKIVKQSKPKVAPDYKPEDFDTGPLPWEQRARLEPPPAPVEAEEPILIPEQPEYLEAVDPLKESEVPDLEDTGIPLPPPRLPTPPPEVEEAEEHPVVEEETEVVAEVIEEKQETREDMENRIADQLVRSVQGMVDPNATVDQQLSQMRAQLAALAQLPEVIQQTLALVSQQLNQMAHQETRVEVSAQMESETEKVEETQNQVTEITEEIQSSEPVEAGQNGLTHEEAQQLIIEEVQEKMETEEQLVQQNMQAQTTEEDIRMEKLKKDQQQQSRLDSEARQIKQRPTPRVGKPKRMFGPPDPDCRPVVLPGGRRWRKTEDVYNEQMIAETLQGQAELIRGKAMGFESDILPFDERINFMKYEKPPVSLDHLQNSATYKLVHDMDQVPMKRVELLTPVIAEADYRERCRSTTPSCDKKHTQIPQQFHP